VVWAQPHSPRMAVSFRWCEVRWVASDQPHSPRMGVSFLSFGQGGLAVWQQGRL